MAAAALRVGVHLRVGNPAALEVTASKASGLRLASGELIAAGTVVLAAGPADIGAAGSRIRLPGDQLDVGRGRHD